VATTITTAVHQDSISGSPEKRLDVSPDGTLWVAVIDVGKIRFFSSQDNGGTYTYSGTSDLSLGSNEDTAVPSFQIDADGFAHVCFVRWQVDPQTITYARGIPRTGGGWSWTTKTLAPAAGRVGVDSDIVAFRNGTGWVAFIAYSYDDGASAGAKMARVDIAANGTISINSLNVGPATNIPWQIKTITFAHTGDGKTPSATPHVFLATATGVGSTDSARWYRYKYQSGNWTFDSPVNFDTAVIIHDTVLCSVYDGTRAFVVWSPTNTTLEAAEWDGAAGSITQRNPPAMPGGTGTLQGISLAVDPSTQDIYLVAYGGTNVDIIWTKFVRATTTWSAWATAVDRGTDNSDGHVQLVRYPPRDSIDMVYTEGTGPYTIKGQQLLALTRSPSAPVLLSPANGALADLASGGTFVWDYQTVSPGDTQQGFVFRRQYGGGPTTEYWNVSTQAWQSGLVVNATDPNAPEQLSFPAGKWTTGTTYNWSARTRSSTGADSTFAANRTVVASVSPKVVVTAPIGIYYGESTPLVQWTYTSINAQRDYQVRIVAPGGLTIDPTNPLPAVFDSGVITNASARNLRVTTSLSDGTAYRAYVRATDINGVQSPWVYSDFTLSLQPPSGPLVEALDIIQYETSVPRVRLDLTARSNFLSSPGALGQADWEVNSNIVLTAQQSDPVNLLVESLKFTSVAAGDMSARTTPGSPPTAPPGRPQPTGPLSFPVIGGGFYTGIAAFKTQTNVRAARVKIRWYDADDGTGAFISETIGSQVNTGTVAYTPGFVTAQAPATAKLARMVVEILGATAASEVYWVGYLSFHPGTDTAWQSGGYATTETLAVERSLDGGTTWEVVTDRIKPDLYQRAQMTDREMPFGTEVKYRATTNVDVGGTAVLSSAFSPVATIAVDNDIWAIRDTLVDLSEFNAYVIDFKEREDDGSEVFWVSGRTSPYVDTEGLRSPSGSLRLYVKPDSIDSVVAILRTTNPLVLQSPVGRLYRVRIIKREYTPTEVSTSRYIDADFYEVV
jgi:hypothetical protein